RILVGPLVEQVVVLDQPLAVQALEPEIRVELELGWDALRVRDAYSLVVDRVLPVFLQLDKEHLARQRTDELDLTDALNLVQGVVVAQLAAREEHALLERDPRGQLVVEKWAR